MPPSSMGTADDILYRQAEPADAALVLSFVEQLAAYEKLAHLFTADLNKIKQHLFGPNKYAECLLAFQDAAPVGFAVFFHNYSTFLGKPGLYIEDIFVPEQYRGLGIGKGFFQAIARLALERDCGRMDWQCLDWNQPALDFYRDLGADSLTTWVPQRLDRAGIERLAQQPLSTLPQAEGGTL